MPTHTTLDPIAAATKAVDALLAALDGNPGSGAAAAYRAALTRHGRALALTSGPKALEAVLARLRAEAPDKAVAAAREVILRAAWQDVVSEARAA